MASFPRIAAAVLGAATQFVDRLAGWQGSLLGISWPGEAGTNEN